MNSFLTRLKHPGFARTLLIRRILAICLLLAAISIALSSRASDQATALRYTRDVAAGEVLQEGDIEQIGVAQHLAQGLQASDVVGRIALLDRRAGSLAAAGDVLDPELTSAAVGEISPHHDGQQAHIVPLTLVDATAATMLVPGDTVTVLSAGTDDAPAQIIAEGAQVIFAGQKDKGGNVGSQRELQGVLLRLDAQSAQAVAAASLSQPLAVVITGARSQ
ncbi:hypothetical protein [Corynebacterium pseudopelargi]|uniref:SAF domain-containing protein n=1 Tax=Corynebacterium pseudopelargi TaxID=2080757 RepID=A0A3G6IV62_9CORY|nr:hypothetical protein [Corynebacterium pseudopelargi]AZA09669.1 hypothetical protein CPPEL_07805 [Corynebacterium pseudopelargi]